MAIEEMAIDEVVDSCRLAGCKHNRKGESLLRGERALAVPRGGRIIHVDAQ